MQTQAIVVMITAPSREVAKVIARVLLEGRLVACVNILPAIASFFWWQGEIHNEQEVLLIAKSRAELFEHGIVPAVRATHPYQVPEIIALPILMSSQDYLDWIKEETVSQT